jgi:hypothetical protein
LVLNFMSVLFCVFMSTVAFHNVSGIFLDFKISSEISFYILSNAFSKL